mmetsp:Transcript_20950/g.49054  ORF Transcript_20950/g.49054 Transcript_20950/m.49054 type:complete len:244 (-) Transcript_20950:75-806(-)
MARNQAQLTARRDAETSQGAPARRPVAAGSKRNWLHIGPKGMPRRVPTTTLAPKATLGVAAAAATKMPKHGVDTPYATPKVPTPKIQKRRCATVGQIPPSPQRNHEDAMIDTAAAKTGAAPQYFVSGALSDAPAKRAKNHTARQREALACSTPRNDCKYMVERPHAPLTAKLMSPQMTRNCPRKTSVKQLDRPCVNDLQRRTGKETGASTSFTFDVCSVSGNAHENINVATTLTPASEAQNGR